jgi:hypothetical protein
LNNIHPDGTTLILNNTHRTTNFYIEQRHFKEITLKAKFALLSFMACAASAPVLAAEPASASAGPAIPNLGASYEITGYLEPNLSSPYTWCFDFTTNGSVLFPDSGTWNVPSYSFGWSGTWYRDGDEIIFHGVADGTFIFSWKGRLLGGGKIAGRQVEFYIDGTTDTAGTFFGKAVSGGCPTAVANSNRDPSR